MDWRRIKNGICPKCGAQMRDRGVLIMCSHPKCDFKIRESRLKEIINNTGQKTGMYKPVSEEESLSDLNNLGYEEMSEGFSDEDDYHLEQ